MFLPHHKALLCALLWAPVPTLASAQASASGKTSAPAANVASSAERAVILAQAGRCKEALPLLKQAKLQAADQDLKRRIGFAGVRCAMFAQQPDAAEDFLRLLNREFPHDPEVLYLSVHTYSDLASRAAADLAITAPQSAQGHELHAESLETNGKWDEAAKEYRLVLEQNPHLPGIHFRLGRLLLSKSSPSPADAEEAKKEMQAELEIDPSNAGKLDASFGDAYVGWGGSLVSLKKFSEAIPPLQTAVKLQSGNPAAHYLLAIAYSRSGRKEEGDREFAIQQKLTQKGAAGEPAESQQSPN